MSDKNNKLNVEDELTRLQTENRKLSRELRHTKMNLDKLSKVSEAKDALNNALSIKNDRQKAYMDMLIDNCPNIIFLLDEDGKFVFSTKIFLDELQLFNFDFIQNKSYEEIFPGFMTEEKYKEIQKIIEDVRRTKERKDVEDVISFDSKEFRNYVIEVIPVEKIKGESVDEATGTLVVLTDTTGFVREKEKAEAASNAKSDFLASMSHEIRTPMNAILGLTEMLNRSDPTKEQQKYLADIQTSADSLLAIINDILDFSKIEAGKIEIINSNFNVQEFFDNLYSIFKFMFENKGIDLKYQLAEGIPKVISADEKRIKQIITNILSNALKYTREGTVAMKVWTTPSAVLRIDISDTGIGIKEEDQNKLFKPFEQLDLKKNKNIIGTGLGLSISHSLALIMEGDLWLESEYGVGSTFSVGIPFEEADQNWTKDSADNIADFITQNVRVLVVDDIEINLTVAEALLSTFGMQVDTALSGNDALGLVKQNDYDLIFMDHMMPEMDGIEATRLIRMMGGRWSTVPIIALTANAITGMREMFLQNSFDDFLPKPLEFNELKRILLNWLPEEKVAE